MKKINFLNEAKCICMLTLIAFTSLMINPLSSIAQTKSNKGTDFWLGFMKHNEDTRAGMSLYITSDSNTSGTVSIPGQNWSTTFNVTANNLTVVNVDVPKAYMSCADCIEARGVKIVSDDNVIVYAHHYEGNKSDATLILPTTTLGKDYFVMSYEENSQFIIVGVKDNTKVNITPSTDLDRAGGGSRSANTTFQITLNEGEVYQGIARDDNNGDVTGTHVEVIDTGATANCRTVAVFGGNSYARIGDCSARFSINSGDNLIEQMFPIGSWGKNFVLVPAVDRSSDDFKIMAAEDGTRVLVFNTSGAPDIEDLDQGEVMFIDDESNVRNVVADKPVMVAQFQQQARCDGSRNRIGDPSMTILNPLEQTLKDITLYSSSFFDIDDHHINIVIPTFYKSSFKLDGASVTFAPVPRKTSYSYARVNVTPGNHRLTADAGFIATAYGKGEFESYGYAAGANVKDLTAVASVGNSTQLNEVSGCIGRPTQFEGEAEYDVVKWEWDFGDGNTDTVQNPSHTYADTGLYIAKLYTYKPTFDGCSNYDSSFVEVTIYAKPEAKVVWEPLCVGKNLRFVDSSSIPDPEVYSFTKWIFDNTTTKGGLAVTHKFDTIGKFPIFMEVATANVCRDTFQDSIVINPNPVALFDVDDACFYDSSVLNNRSTISSGAIDSFFWTVYKDVTDSTLYDENPTWFLPDSGYHDIILTVMSDSGCTNSFDSFTYKYPRFDVSFSYNDTCLGIENSFLNTSILEGGRYTDTIWYTSVPDTAYSFNYSKTFEDATSFTVDLIMEQDSFCRDTFSQTITVDPLVDIAFDIQNTCLGESTIFTDNSALAQGTYTLDWNFDDLFTGSGSPESVDYVNGGVKTISLQTTTDKGCVSDSSTEITITYPEITDINSVDICTGVAQELSSSNILGLDSFDSYSWSIDGAVVSMDSSFSYTTNIVGVKMITLDVITKNGCSVSLLDSFEVFVGPSANFFITPVCLGEDVTPADNSTINSPGVISSYKWFVDGVQVSDRQNPSFVSTDVGSSSLMQVVESDNGCLDTLIKSLLVNPLPVVSFSSADNCENDITLISSTSTIASGSINDHQWTIERNNYLYVSFVDFQFPSAGTYSVKLVEESDQGCLDSTTTDVVIHPLPLLDVTLADYDGCMPFEIDIINNTQITSGSISSYRWEFGDGNVQTGDITNYTYQNPGTYNIKVHATSDQGCSDSLDISNQVTVYDLPNADFRFSPLEPSTITEFVTFKDSSSSDVTQWDWSISDGGMYSGSEVRHTFADSGTFQVSLLVTNDNGCTDEEVKDVYVNADLFIHIPNSFTPNGDPLNNTYGLGGLTQGVVDLNLRIYNRWGEQIFESTNVDDRWDGTYKGKPVPQGVYVYLIQFTNPKRSQWYYYKGEIHLLR